MEKDGEKQTHNGDEYALLLNTIEPVIASVLKRYNRSIMIPLYVLVIILFLNIIQTMVVFRLLWKKTIAGV
tara:strand:+ start:369 stop:581 length:213 start_codon:yes stop_codon:yes gene_type:complete